MKKYLLAVEEKLKSKLKQKNRLALPWITKVVINCGIGSKVKTNQEFLKQVSQSLALITGQKPASRLAKKAIAGFKVRQGEVVGLKVTLRGRRLADFVYKLVHITLPRARDFHGLKKAGFDKDGNYSLGLSEQIIFGEVADQKTETIHGLLITIVTSAGNPEIGQILLESWGFPFAKSPNLKEG